MQKLSNKKFIWAVDAFAPEKEMQLGTFKALSQISGGRVSIEPVYVLSPDELKVPRSAFQAGSKTYELEAETLLKRWTRELNVPEVLEPTLLVQDHLSRDSAVHSLLSYARQTGAELIGVSAHSRKAVERLLFGSFAESLVLQSEIPVLVCRPGQLVRKLSRILFPTDFSEASRTAFDKLIPTAAAQKSSVTIYYKIDYVVPATLGAFDVVPSYRKYLEEDIEAQRKKAMEWKSMAEKAGVTTNVVVDDSPQFIIDGLLGQIKDTNCDLVAMASRSGALASVLLGGVTRKVLRESTVPVWVIHPEKN